MYLFYVQKAGSRSNVRYVDRYAIAQALADEHKRRHEWGNVAGWVFLSISVLAFWYWAFFC